MRSLVQDLTYLSFFFACPFLFIFSSAHSEEENGSFWFFLEEEEKHEMIASFDRWDQCPGCDRWKKREDECGNSWCPCFEK